MITQDQLRSLLHYDPTTGVFTRRVLCGGQLPGSEAGSIWKSKGYAYISIGKRDYGAHRLAWLYMTGFLPPNGIDHKNGVRHDNRWSNLRLATAAQNNQNLRQARSDSKSGILGVIKLPGGKWMAKIGVDGKRFYLGRRFTSPEEASAAYIKAKRRLHSHGCL